MVHIQSMNSDGKTWSTVATDSTVNDPGLLSSPRANGMFIVELTTTTAGVYTYRVTYDGDSKYASAISNTVTLTVTNVAMP
jgi:hypothetical protein